MQKSNENNEIHIQDSSEQKYIIGLEKPSEMIHTSDSSVNNDNGVKQIKKLSENNAISKHLSNNECNKNDGNR